MARLSDIIETFLKELIKEENTGVIEIQRNELANKFKCVPSQINYVIGTRFTNDKGYYVESRRGGGGHIRIKRVEIKNEGNYLMHSVLSIGNRISQQAAEAFINNFVDYDILTQREALILKAVTYDKVLGDDKLKKDEIRANILKNALISLIV
ncbi:MAG: CtsR family transcriptional regulator [Clostridiales bacterium]